MHPAITNIHDHHIAPSPATLNATPESTCRVFKQLVQLPRFGVATAIRDLPRVSQLSDHDLQLYRRLHHHRHYISPIDIPSESAF